MKGTITYHLSDGTEITHKIGQSLTGCIWRKEVVSIDINVDGITKLIEIVRLNEHIQNQLQTLLK